jgi:hypothetical protein
MSLPLLCHYFQITLKIKFELFKTLHAMEQHALKNVNNCLNTSIYSYLETSGGQSSNLYLNDALIFSQHALKDLLQL